MLPTVLRPVLALLTIVVVTASWPTAAATTSHVHIQNFSFNPSPLNIRVGESVNWDNHDGAPHTVTSDAGHFDSGDLNMGDTFDFTFEAAGIYDYHCSIHGFTGQVIVGDPPPLPDLVVSGIASEQGTPALNQRIDVTVRNLGLADAGATMVHLDYIVDGDARVIGDIEMPSVAAGDSATRSLTWNTLGKVGDFLVVARADSLNEVQEEDEENNEAQATVTVLVGGFAGIALLP